MSASSPNVPYVGEWVAATCDGDPFTLTIAPEGQVLGRVIATRADGVQLHSFRWVPWRYVRPCPPPNRASYEYRPSETGAMGDRQQLPPTPKENE